MFNEDDENNEYDNNDINNSIGVSDNLIPTNEQVCLTLQNNNNYYS